MPQPTDTVVTAHVTSRRKLLAGATGLIALASLNACSTPEATETAPVAHAETPKTPDELLKALKEGNQRYLSNELQHPNQDEERRDEQAEHQSPFALIHGCVDSRVTPELLFDQGIGDLFVTRTAGAVLDDTLVGSMEFAVSEPYSVPLLVILGHTACGAVTGTLQAMEKNADNPELPGEMDDFAEQIAPVARKENVSGSDADAVNKVVKANAIAVAQQLVGRSVIIRKAVQEKRTRVVSAVYDLQTGEVSWLES
ncbi:carbonic anhydrase [Glutamicibacter sp. AOP5-A2-18]|uniref:carbonic anhydrase n=1 Tax=Glutamicibacter sp. AOP5-A2-18 TaxID=3457656 RepID=UPI00403348F0